ncbi:hypothetical protein Cabys_1337 [Caldithrix abyssi DSM 13497]|uniref:Uncharacterized protein n=1 Tax=Caldithrix abyssi DSM 13497 TaxID=880073 RepID=A0A1J1C693_CALAY|nr:hypothetical protein Cabys_1337 [Caldithrix abyssi DSM 13497]
MKLFLIQNSSFAFVTYLGYLWSLKIICLIIFCDDWRNLQENYFARVAVDFGCGHTALNKAIS